MPLAWWPPFCWEADCVDVARLLPDNPHVRFFDSRPRGYVRCTVTPERWLTELRALENAVDPRTAIGTLASFVVESGRPGAQRL